MDTNSFFVFFIHKKRFWALSLCILCMIALNTLSNYRIGLLNAFLVAIVVLYYFQTKNKSKEAFDNYIETLSTELESAAQNTMLMLALPIVVVTVEGEILWENSFFSKIFSDRHNQKQIVLELTETLNNTLNDKDKKEIKEEIIIGDRHYNVMGRLIEKFNGMENKVLLLYLFDDSEICDLKKKFQDEKLVVGVIMIDNYDDLMQSMNDSKRSQLLAEIDAKVVEWAEFTSGILRKYERDKYLIIMQKKYLTDVEDRKFDILESVKDINLGNKFPVTLSMGIDNSGETYANSFQYAVSSLEIALGRGGDQVVVKNKGNIQFYGGKTRELEKRTRVKARVIAQALREVMNQSPQIMVMGHTNCDIDSLGAAMGIHRIATSLKIKSHIVLDSSNPTIDAFIERISKVSEYDGVFIDKAQASDLITKNTLLVVVDTHRPSYTECPELLKLTQHIVVIDHHRRGAEFIQDLVLTYHEPYASSTCELVTEIIQYIEEFVKIEVLEAELLYSGIVVDTKAFTFKTGVRTFEAAAYLRKKGVDTTHVKQLLQNDLESYINISNIVKEVKISNNNIAISVSASNVKNSVLIAAQAADQILGIAGIAAAFVVTDTGNGIFISGRSFGDVNVQVILEKIGGGGHQTVSGAQFYDIEVADVVDKLKFAIEEYLKEVTKEV